MSPDFELLSPESEITSDSVNGFANRDPRTVPSLLERQTWIGDRRERSHRRQWIPVFWDFFRR